MSKASLHAIDAEPAVSPDVIERLTEVCRAVEMDQVSSVAVAIVYRDGTTGSAWSTAASFSLLIGAVERMKNALLRAAED